jgi:hypothetical protein
MVARCGGPTDGRGQGSIVRFPRQGDDGDTVTLRGPKDVVDKLRGELEKAAGDLRDRIVYAVHVPAGGHASIIGRGGSSVNELSRKHNVKILFPSWGEHATVGDAVNATDVAGTENSDIVKLVGSRSACEAAAKELSVSAMPLISRGQLLMLPHRTARPLRRNGLASPSQCRDICTLAWQRAVG